MTRLHAVISLGLALIVAGCGGQDPGAEPAPETPAAAPEQAAGAPVADPDGPDPARVAALEAAVRDNPDDPEALRNLGIVLHSARRREEAVTHFERAAEIDPTPRRLLDLALAYGAVSRLDDSEATYGRLLELAPEDPIALHNLGNLAVTRNRPKKAIELYRRALAARPDYLLAVYHLGDALRLDEQYKEAYVTYGRALEMEPTSPAELEALDDSLYQMAALDLMMGAPARAGEMLTELVRHNPQHPSAHYALGQALLQIGRPEEAQREFEIHMAILEAIEPTGPVATGQGP